MRAGPGGDPGKGGNGEVNVRTASRIVLAASAVLGLLAAVLVARYLHTAATRPAAVVQTVPEVVATQAIPADTVITGRMVAVRAVPAPYAVPGSAQAAGAVVGGVSKVDIAAGEPVLAAAVANPRGGAGLAFQVPKGQVALTIPVDQLAGQDGMLRPGDRVDVLAILSPGNGVPSQRVTTALRSVRVLAVGQTTSPGAAAGGYGTVTLAVSPAHAEEIVYLMRFEGITLTLQPAAHRESGHVNGFDQTGLAGVAS
jgi:pilus assembly protein CpaB